MSFLAALTHVAHMCLSHIKTSMRLRKQGRKGSSLKSRKLKWHSLQSVIMNSYCLLQLQLENIQILLPSLLTLEPQ